VVAEGGGVGKGNVDGVSVVVAVEEGVRCLGQ
jgi:hypothetical protein